MYLVCNASNIFYNLKVSIRLVTDLLRCPFADEVMVTFNCMNAMRKTSLHYLPI